MLPTADQHPLKGKVIQIPPMAYGSARAFASAFRAIGLDAEPTPPSDHRTRELGAHYTSGDECYPAKVTVGDFMKVVERPGQEASKLALFMPTAQGPCRFGQYAPYLRHILDTNGYDDVEILSPTSQNAYGGLGTLSKPFVRTGWRALLCADLLAMAQVLGEHALAAPDVDLSTAWPDFFTPAMVERCQHDLRRQFREAEARTA